MVSFAHVQDRMTTRTCHEIGAAEQFRESAFQFELRVTIPFRTRTAAFAQARFLVLEYHAKLKQCARRVALRKEQTSVCPHARSATDRGYAFADNAVDSWSKPMLIRDRSYMFMSNQCI